MPSSATLTTLRDRLEAALMDAANAIWNTGQLDEALRAALDEYSALRPLQAIGALTLASDTREVSLASLTGLLDVTRVWFPYDAAAPLDAESFVPFEVYDDAGTLTLRLQCDTDPAANEVARVYYVKRHTLNGLDGGTATTFDVRDDLGLVLLAAGYCCWQRSTDLNETSGNMAVSTPNYAALAELFFKRARELLERRAPAWTII